MVDTTPQNTDNNEDFYNRLDTISKLWFQNKLEFSEAISQFETLLHEAISENDKEKEATVYGVLGITYGYSSDYANAIKNFKLMRQISEDSGDLYGIANADLDLGKAYRLLGNFPRAKECFRNAYELGLSTNDMSMQVFALANEGQIWASLKDFKKARQTLEKAISVSVKWEVIGDQSINIRSDTLCETHHALVEIELVENNVAKAWEHAIKSLDYAKETERVIRMGYAYRAIGDVVTLLDEVPDDYQNDADYYYDEAFKAFKEVNAEGEIAETLFSHGKSLSKRGKRRSAGNKLQQAMIIFTRLGMLDSAAEVGNEQTKII